MSDPHVTARSRAAAVVLLSCPQRGGQPRGARGRGARGPADLAEAFEIIAVDDGSQDGTPAIADALAAAHPDVVRVVHHPTNLGYGAALRSGFGAARYELVAFTDGDRQFQVADLGRLTARLAAAGHAGRRSSASGSSAPTRSCGSLYARAYRLANRIFFGLTVTDVDCACKLFRREALERAAGRVRRRLLLGRDDHQAARRRPDRRRGRRPALPAHGGLGDRRQAAASSCARSATSGCLRLRMWVNRGRALRRGEPMVRPQG